jgi:hypothetical protein
MDGILARAIDPTGGKDAVREAGALEETTQSVPKERFNA